MLDRRVVWSIVKIKPIVPKNSVGFPVNMYSDRTKISAYSTMRLLLYIQGFRRI